MASRDHLDPSILAVLRDLDAARKRLDQAPTWLRDGETSVAIAALAEEARRLCQQASMCEDKDTVQSLISIAKQRLADLQKLLGLH